MPRPRALRRGKTVASFARSAANAANAARRASGRPTGGPQTVQPDDVRLDEEADRALEDAEEAAETDERSMDVERAELAEGEEAATTDDGRKDR
ncbi:MAG: hypothetical protein ACLTJ9_13500 [Eggerthella lenta]